MSPKYSNEFLSSFLLHKTQWQLELNYIGLLSSSFSGFAVKIWTLNIYHPQPTVAKDTVLSGVVLDCIDS